MGVTISSRNHSCDVGYGGFNRFRKLVAEKVGSEFHEHYSKLEEPDALFSFGESRKHYFEEYDKKTKKLIEDGKVSIEIANFCYQSDCEGKIDSKQSKIIYDLIKDCDDELSFGYSGRVDCAKLKDFKKIFLQGSKTKTKVKWY